MKARLALLGFLVLGQLVNLLAIVRYLWAVVSNVDRARRIAVSWDQLGNTTFNGNEDETISSRAGRAKNKGKRWGCVLCRYLDWFDRNHCEKSIERRFLQLIAKRAQRHMLRRIHLKRKQK
jgi:hypothetical protein